ncbi:hypothetical protein PFISCL1PPCAC_11694, partial [Pristionchus fissidentatus]
ASSLGVSGSSSVSSSVQSSMSSVSSPSIPSLSSSVCFSAQAGHQQPFPGPASQGAARAPDLPQDALSSLLQVLRPHLQAAPTHTIPRVSSQELQERLSTLTEFLNQAERVKHGSEDMDALLAAMKQRVQLLVASEKTPGLLDSVARLRVIRDASDGADAGLIAAALQMSERERPFSSARRDRSRSPFRARGEARGSSSSRFNARRPSPPRFDAKLVCFSCGRKGHKSPDCHQFAGRRIRDGLSLDLPDGMDPNYFTFTGNRNSAVEQAEFVAATVLEWLRSGAVVKAEPDEPLAVFPLSVVSNDTREEAQRAATIVHSDIQSAGMRVNEGKSQWIPSQSGKWLGFDINLKEGVVEVCEKRLSKALECIREMLARRKVSMKLRQQVLGHIASMSLVLGDEACLMARSMQLEVVRMEETSEKATSMDERERSELNYWERGEEECCKEVSCTYALNSGIRGARLEELQREFAGGGLGELGELAEEALRGSLAPSTVTAYSNSDRARKELAKSLGMEEDAELSLCAFVLQKLLKGQSKASLGVAVSAFGFMTGVSPLGTRYGDVIGAALKTASRKRATVSHGKAELPHLQAILLWAGREDGSRKDRRIGSVSLLLFGCLLRVSEASALKREEVIVTIGDENTISISVRVAKAKNDQLRSGRNTFLCLKKGSPGRVLWEEYSRDLASSPSPWFFPSLQDPARAITTDGIRTELKRVCEELGLPTLTPHTFRGGGASAALESGVPLEKVQRLGRWTSAQGMTPYIRDSVESQGGTFLL